MDKSRLDKQIQFSTEIDKEKEIFRQTYLADASRKENDAEHAWHAAIMTYLLAEYANEKIDVAKTMMMLLIHDIVEVDAGDTYAYDEVGKQTQKEREEKAADRIYSLLPEDQGKALRALWDEFEEGVSAEARFAKVMDNLQPMMLNVASDGKAWLEHEVAVSKILKRNERTPLGSKILWDYAKENWIKPYIEAGIIIDDEGLLKK
ncbi:MAG: HD domain-containing protein [Lachnospiraceae bacterium]